MKKIVLGIAFLAAGLISAQKKEIQTAFKAIESNDTATATAEINKAENLLGGKLYLLEPVILEQYYYTKGVTLIKAGKTAEGAEYLGKIADLKTVYTGRDAQKNKVYFANKSAADQSGIQGLKPENYEIKTSTKVATLVNPLLKTAGDEAYKAYQNKDYKQAAHKYLEVANLLKAVGGEGQTYKYYAAANFSMADQKQEAIKAYKELIEDGYTGVTTQYLATDVKTGQVVNFDKNSFDVIKKTASKEYTDLKTETTPSVEKELYESTAGLLIDVKKYNEALSLIERGLKKFPQSSRLSELQSLAYYRSGRTAEFIENLKKQVAQNPNDKESWYNLGYLQSQEEATIAEAEKSFQKALEIDPKYTLALQGLAYAVYLKNDGKIVDEIKSLQKAKKIDEMNKKLEQRRATFKKALPYLERYHAIEPENLEVIATLKGIHMSLDHTDKYNHFKKLEESLTK